MVEKIIINPDKVRGYGNIKESGQPADYTTYKSVLGTIQDTVNGVVTSVFNLTYSLYGFVFGWDNVNEQIYLTNESGETLNIGWDNTNKQIYLNNETEENVTLGWDNTNKQIYVEV